MDTGWQQRLRRGARRLYTLAYATIADVKIGPHAIVMPGAVLKDDKGGSLTIGAGSVIHHGAMLLPYLLWLGFAGALAGRLWTLNPDGSRFVPNPGVEVPLAQE